MSKNNIGGSIFVHNAVEFDYCIAEAIKSLAGFCDEISVLDASSTDGTIDILRSLKQKYSFTLTEGISWDIVKGKERLSILANIAKDKLNTEWQFMLQADEVIHESSYESIKNFCQEGLNDVALCTRFNLWGDFNSYIRPDSMYLPCSHEIFRLGKKDLNTFNDGESLLCTTRTRKNMSSEIFIFHYGLMRKNFIHKVISMGTWFFGNPDHRYVNMKEKNTGFDAYSIIPKEATVPLPINHPEIMQEWIEERKQLFEGGRL